MTDNAVSSREEAKRTMRSLGVAHYHLTGHGGLSVLKWESAHSKIDPVLDQLLINHPKVEMGVAPKTAAN